jgi:predicted aspartyl protease
MIVLNLWADARGRALVDLYVAASAPRSAALESSGKTPPQPVAVRALIDTGATRTNVDRSVLKRLELDPVGPELVHTASTAASPREVDAYAVRLFLPGVLAGLIASDLRVLEAENLSGLGVEVLLGLDVLKKCLLFYNGSAGQLTLAIDPEA